MAETLMKQQNCVQTLNILMMKEGITPVYELIDQVVGTNNCLFTYRLVFGELEVCGSGSSKKLARHTAAEAMLQKLGEIDRKGQNDGESEADNRLRSFAIDILRAIGQKFYSAQPFYEEIEESGPVHMRKFTYECTLIDYKIKSTHRKKKTAKADSALKMIMLLGEKYPEIAEFVEKQRNIVSSNKYTIEHSENKKMAIDLQSGGGDTVDLSKNHNSMSNEEHRASSSSNGNFEVNCQPENTVRMDFVSKMKFSLIQRHVVLKKIDNFFAICERMDQADYNKLDNETDLSKEFDQIMKIMHIEYEEFVHQTFDGNFITSIYLMGRVESAVNCDAEYSRATAYYCALHFLKELLGSRS